MHIKMDNKILTPTSRFGDGNRTEKKQGVIKKLMDFFERNLRLV